MYFLTQKSSNLANVGKVVKSNMAAKKPRNPSIGYSSASINDRPIILVSMTMFSEVMNTMKALKNV